METAAIIAQVLGTKQIYVNYLLSEWMKAAFYPSGNPFGKLISETMPAQQFSEKYMHGVSFTNFKTNADQVVFPEIYSAQRKRQGDHL